MNIIKSVETLLWKKEELKNIGDWVDNLELNEKPVNGIHWRHLRKNIDCTITYMQISIEELENDINSYIEGLYK